jgi:quercetin dioxygenase-like cupin family protein
MSTMTTEEIQLGPLAIRFLVDGAASGGTVAMFEFDVPASAKLPVAHSHDAYEETIYGLRGVTSWTVDGDVVDVGPGDAVVIPRGVVHRFDNAGTEDATMLAIVTPALLGPDYFRELAAVVDAAAGGPPDPSEIVAVMLRHGLTPAP